MKKKTAAAVLAAVLTLGSAVTAFGADEWVNNYYNGYSHYCPYVKSEVNCYERLSHCRYWLENNQVQEALPMDTAAETTLNTAPANDYVPEPNYDYTPYAGGGHHRGGHHGGYGRGCHNW